MIRRHLRNSQGLLKPVARSRGMGLAVGVLTLMAVYPITGYGEDAPRTWVVGKDMPTLEGAVEKARAGDIIELPAGEYRLQKPLVVGKSLTLRGAGAARSKVRCEAEGWVLRLEGKGRWQLEGLTWEHGGESWADVVVVEGGELEMRGCVCRGGVQDEANKRSGAGLWLTGKSKGVVRESEFVGNGLHGIQVSGESVPVLEGNRCEENQKVGIAYGDRSGGTARNNICQKNGGSGIEVGGESQVVLEENQCDDNDRYGIYVTASARPKLGSNSSRGNKKGDIYRER